MTCKVRDNLSFTIRFLSIVLAVCLLSVSASSADEVAAEAASTTASTTENPAVDPEHLRLLIKPLTKDELAVEVDAWQGLLKEKVREISAAEIASRKKKEEIKEVQNAAAALEEAKKATEKQASGASQEAKKDVEEKLDEAKSALEKAATIKKDPVSADLKKAEVEAVKEKVKKQKDEKLASNEKLDPSVVSKSADASEMAQHADKLAGLKNDGSSAEKQIAEESKVLDKLAERDAEIKTALLDNLNRLRTERSAIVGNIEIVLDEFEAKGGDAELYRKYVSSVSGLTVDVSDTESVILSVTGWLESEQGGLRWGINFLQFLGIVLFFFIVSRVFGSIVENALRRLSSTSQLLTRFIARFVRQSIVIVGLVVALTALEINVGPILAAIGAAGFVIAFALQDTLSNFASGLLLLAYRPFDEGDIIEAAGITGKVDSISLFSSYIRTFDNKQMIVPNNDIWKGTITNATASKIRRVDMVFGIGYNDNIDLAVSTMERILEEHPAVLDDPAPNIKLHELADSSVNFICRPWVKTEDYWAVYWDVTRKVKEEFDRHGVSIPFPQRDVHVYHEQVAAGLGTDPTLEVVNKG